MRLTILCLLVTVSPLMADPPQVEKVVLDRAFRSEGVAVADVDGDGRLDVLTGEHWYQAPDWQPRPMRPVVDHKDGLNNYSRVFACFADDFNADGHPDLLIIGFPGQPCFWMENPGPAAARQGATWKQHEVWHSACNETPLYGDLLGLGKNVLVMGTQPKGAKPDGNAGEMAYFTPSADPTAVWTKHTISGPAEPGQGYPGTQRFAHGLGVGDVNTDGRPDVITTAGWWEQPERLNDAAWRFHPADLGPPCANMVTLDLTGDGTPEVVSSSAHKFGVWAFDRAGDRFTRRDLFPDLVSETHAMILTDFDGDGTPDLVTGKRFWSHGRSEPGSDQPAVVVLLKGQRSEGGRLTFTPITLDADSGIGTQFVVTDLNADGKPDIVTSNKKGVRVLLQR